MAPVTADKSARANGPDPHPILDPSARVCERAGRVRISQEAIRQLAGELSSSNESSHWLTSAPAAFVSVFEQLPLQRQILFLTVFHSAGFSYWGDPPWSVSDGGTTYNGSMAWFIALSRDERCLDAQFLAGLTAGQWQTITSGSGRNGYADGGGAPVDFAKTGGQVEALRKRHLFQDSPPVVQHLTWLFLSAKSCRGLMTGQFMMS
jgi:hypothetical protein